MAALVNGADVQLSYFNRYSSVHFIPDPIGDIIFNGVASEVFRSDFANGVTGDIAIGSTRRTRCAPAYSCAPTRRK